MSGKDDDMMGSDDPINDDLDASEEIFAEGGSFEPGEIEDDGGDAEDWEAYDGEFTTDEGEGIEALVVKKKKSTNMIVIGGALVIGVGILLMTLANNKPVNKSIDNTNAGALPGVTENAPKFSSSTPVVVGTAPAGLLNDPEALRNLPNTIAENKINSAANTGPAVPQVNPGAPVAVTSPPASVSEAPAPETAVPVSESVTPPPMPAPVETQTANTAHGPDALTPMPTPTPTPSPPPSATPVEGGLTAPMPEQPVAAVQPAPEPVVSPPAETQKTAEPGFTVAPVMTTHTDNADPALNARLDQLLDRVNAVEAKLADVQKQPAATELQTMQQTLDQISSRLDKLEARKSTAIVVHPSASAANTASAAQTAAAPKAKARTTSRRHSVERKTSARWVLKSAQPGQAYVSRPGQADMISVHIGDTLQGIGHVTAIDSAGGRWIIHGTQGSVYQ